METTDQNIRCVILADGQFPTSRPALDALRQACYICCCDGAVEKLLAHGFMPSAIVGDGDSVLPETKQKFANIFIKVEEQETNDLTKATQHCIAKGFRKITYLGATGLREDHSIANIFLLPHYFETLDVEPTMITDHGIFTVHRGTQTFESRPGRKISVFNISCTELSSTGLKWPVSPFTKLWQGTLNQAADNRFTVNANGVYLVYTCTHDPAENKKGPHYEDLK